MDGPKDAPEGAHCAKHPDRPAEIECLRCGDYVGSRWRAYVLCAACAREAPPTFRPVPRARYLTRWLPLLPVPFVFVAALVVRWLDWLDVTSALWFHVGVLAVMLLSIVSWLVRMYDGRSAREAGKARERHRELEANRARSTDLAPLAPQLMATPKAHAALLLSLARAHVREGTPQHARPLLNAVAASGWLLDEEAKTRADVNRALAAR